MVSDRLAGDPSAGDEAVDLVAAELRELAERVCTAAGDPTQAFGVYGFAGATEASRLARHVEQSVFGETFGNGPELFAREYGPYEAASYFFCVVDHRRRLPAGMMRVLLPSPAGSKSLADLERVWRRPPAEVLERSNLALTADRTWDVATLAVERGYRRAATNGLVSMALYQTLCGAAVRYDLGWIVTILDLVVLDMIQEISHGCYEPFAGVEPMGYLDSPASLPVYCDVAAQLPRLKAVDPATYELLVDGRGLEDAVTPPDWESMDADLGAPSVTRSPGHVPS